MDFELSEVARYMRMPDAHEDAAVSERMKKLAGEAPLEPRGVWIRDKNRCLLCGTVGAAFDVWQRRLSVVSATDALIAQAIGAAAVERVMDGLEAEIRLTLAEGEILEKRRSPGYGDVPLSANAEILSRLDAARRIGVSHTGSMSLVPAKSVVAWCDVKTADCRACTSAVMDEDR